MTAMTKDIQAALEQCRTRAAAYLDAQRVETSDACYWRHSPAHDPGTHPGHLLYGTWAGALASLAIGTHTRFTSDERCRIANALNGFQRDDGTFMLPGIPEEARTGHDDEYLAFHCSNYALGALRALGERPRYPLSFALPFTGGPFLESWLAARDWSRPWTEGNKIVNVASFLAMLADDGDSAAGERLVEMADWHDAHQHPRTGFWHLNPADDWGALMQAMAGAAHVYHLYYYLGRDVPLADRIVESCLRLGYMGVRSACIDIDVVDILVHFRRYGHRLGEVDSILERYLVELLQVQNPDGGFSDSYVSPHRIYGHCTPADQSVTWTTWFRLATIGMICSALLPGERGRWLFRDTLGMGYCSLPYAMDGVPGAVSFGAHCRPPQRVLLTVRREGRFARQRATLRARTWLAGAAPSGSGSTSS